MFRLIKILHIDQRSTAKSIFLKTESGNPSLFSVPIGRELSKLVKKTEPQKILGTLVAGKEA